MTANVFLYARRSEKKGKNESISIDKQIEEMRLECAKNNFNIVSIFQETESWFHSGKRGQYGKMIEEIKKRNVEGSADWIDYVMVYMTSRLGRNTDENHELVKLVTEDELFQIYSIKEDYGPEWWRTSVKFRFREDLDHAVRDSKLKSTDSRINMHEAITQKGKLPVKPPFWYSVTGRGSNTRFCIDEDAARIVKECFQLYSTGNYSYSDIADHLNAQWHKKSRQVGGPAEFTYMHICKIITNELYFWGYKVTYRNMAFEDRKYFFSRGLLESINQKNATIDYTKILQDKPECFQPIIPESLFEICKDVRRWKRTSAKGVLREQEEATGREYTWKWILRCPCLKKLEDYSDFREMRSMTSETKTKKSGKSYHYYRCSRNQPKLCGNESTSWSLIEKVVYDKVLRYLKFTAEEKDLYLELIKSRIGSTDTPEEIQRKSLEANIETEKSAIDRLQRKIVKENDDTIYALLCAEFSESNKRLKQFESELEQIPTATKDDLERFEEFAEYIDRIAEDFHNLPPRKRANIADVIFEFAVFYRKELIDFKLKPFFQVVYDRGVLTMPNHSKKEVRTLKKKNSKPRDGHYSLDVSFGTPHRTPVKPKILQFLRSLRDFDLAPLLAIPLAA